MRSFIGADTGFYFSFEFFLRFVHLYIERMQIQWIDVAVCYVSSLRVPKPELIWSGYDLYDFVISLCVRLRVYSGYSSDSDHLFIFGQ